MIGPSVAAPRGHGAIMAPISRPPNARVAFYAVSNARCVLNANLMTAHVPNMCGRTLGLVPSLMLDQPLIYGA